MTTDTGKVVIAIWRGDLEAMLTKAKSRPDMHSRSCAYFAWWGGNCNCWVSEARRALEAADVPAKYPPPAEGSK